MTGAPINSSFVSSVRPTSEEERSGVRETSKEERMKSVRVEAELLVSSLVEVIAGPIKKEMNLAGMTVKDAYKALRDPLNIPPGVTALVDGKIADPETRLRPGSCLEFVKPAGEKG